MRESLHSWDNANLVRIIDFQGCCDSCCYFYLDPQFDSHQNPDLLGVHLGTKWNYWVTFIAGPPNEMGGGAGSEREISKDTGQESWSGSIVGFFLPWH